jgi:hypothetical protein
LARTSSAQAAISFGCINTAPQAPRLPAFISAIDKDGGQAPAIGASSIGSFKPKRLQNNSARVRSRDILLSLRLAFRSKNEQVHGMKRFGKDMIFFQRNTIFF